MGQRLGFCHPQRARRRHSPHRGCAHRAELARRSAGPRLRERRVRAHRIRLWSNPCRSRGRPILEHPERDLGRRSSRPVVGHRARRPPRAAVDDGHAARRGVLGSGGTVVLHTLRPRLHLGRANAAPTRHRPGRQHSAGARLDAGHRIRRRHGRTARQDHARTTPRRTRDAKPRALASAAVLRHRRRDPALAVPAP